jgi:cytochrome c peroxidase
LLPGRSSRLCFEFQGSRRKRFLLVFRTALASWLVLLGGSALQGADVPLPPQDTLPAVLDLQTIPLGLDQDRPAARDNPLTKAKVQLGRRLFFDPILSADGTVACASCHSPAHGFADGERFPAGIGGKRNRRNAPTLLNRAYGGAFFWDGRETTLEGQALRPIDSPLEMGGTVAVAVERLRKRKDYADQFRAAFPEGVTAENLARALASFERVLLTGNSRVDRFRAGEIAALNAGERHGLWLYESRGGCWRCHRGPNFTDESFHNTGVGWGKTPSDIGRYEHTHNQADRGRFKTPTLRGLRATAPYMHDGSLATLQEVVEFYNRGCTANPNLDPAITPLGLSENDVKDLVAFLQALSDAPPKLPHKP